ncbi:MAG: tetratricopeptide repeat protein [Nitrospirae bacterium]|nr:tetratricopeptide repeat protein [Nitrospirota bacterium]
MSIVRDALKRVEERRRLTVDPHQEKALLVSQRSRRTQTIAFWVVLGGMLLGAGGLAIWVLPGPWERAPLLPALSDRFVAAPDTEKREEAPALPSTEQRSRDQEIRDQEGAQGEAGRLLLEGIRFYRGGDLRQAEEAFRAALARDSASAEAQNNLGLALRAQGRLPEAIAAYQAAIRLRPDYPEAHHNLGVASFSLGRLEEAIQSFREAIRIREGFAPAHLQLALALEQRGDGDAAAWHFRRYLSMAPSDEREVAEKVRMRLKVSQ